MSERTWSKYQTAIFEHVQTKGTNLVIEALAGSGKSTVIEEITKRIPRQRRVCVSAFNASTRAELESRIKAPNVTVRTFHQIGFGAVRKHWPTIEMDATRQRSILSTVIPGGRLAPDGALSDVTKLVSMVMSRLASTDQEYADIMDTYDCGPKKDEDRPRYIEWARECLRLSQNYDGCLSFDDQIYLPIAMDLRLAQYDDVLVDEAQDCNPLQLELLKRSVKPGGRFIAVGDTHQAIYSFRGADSNTMELLIKEMAADRLPLSVCYRCPTKVVELAQNIVPEFEAAPQAKDGEVNIIGAKEFYDSVRPGDLVVSRKNAALAECLIELLRRKKRCFIIGKDLGSGLIAFITKIGGDSILEFTKAMGEYVTRETARLVVAKKEAQIEALHDKAAMINALSDGLESTEQLTSRIRGVFGETSGGPQGIVLSSVHKAKGLEYDTVWMLESTFSMRGTESANLYYVAATRAKRVLNLVQLPNAKGQIPPSIAEEWASE